MKKEIHDGKTSHVHELEYLTLSHVNVTLIYRFSATPLKIPVMFFEKIEKSNLKFIWQLKKPQRVTTILKKKTHKVRRLPLRYFKTYYKATGSLSP